MSDAVAAEILRYWIEELGAERWWQRSEETDSTIVARFADLWEERRHWPAERFLGSREDALAAILLFDQFPRNMFRHSAQAFASDALAHEIADKALACRFDEGFEPGLRLYFYLPFEHAETLADQERAVRLVEPLGLPDPLDYARKHRDMIARFGRFPARNPALGRVDADGEAEARAESAGW